MPHNKLQVFCFVIAIFFIGFIFLYGCGNTTGGGGGGGGVSGINTGTVTGHVYYYIGETGTCVGTPDAIVTVSTEAMSLEVSVKTGSSGSFEITDLPSGTILLTATHEGCNPLTVVANSNTVNFVINDDYNDLAGTATIKGTVEGIVGSPVLFQVKPYSYTGKFYDYSFKCNSTTGTYEITGAPDEGLTYVKAVYTNVMTTDVAAFHYAYGKVNTTVGGTSYLNITFESGVTLDANFSLPTDHSIIEIRVYITNDHKLLSDVFRTPDPISITSSPYKIINLPPLKAGDNYCVQITTSDEAGAGYRKYFYGCSAGSNYFDLTPPVEQSTFIISPAGGGSFTGTTSFEWEPVNGVNYYRISLDGPCSYNIFTYGTKITLPGSLIRQLPTGTYNFFIIGYKTYANPPIYNMIHTRYIDTDFDYLVWSKRLDITY